MDKPEDCEASGSYAQDGPICRLIKSRDKIQNGGNQVRVPSRSGCNGGSKKTATAPSYDCGDEEADVEGEDEECEPEESEECEEEADEEESEDDSESGQEECEEEEDEGEDDCEQEGEEEEPECEQEEECEDEGGAEEEEEECDEESETGDEEEDCDDESEGADDEDCEAEEVGDNEKTPAKKCQSKKDVRQKNCGSTPPPKAKQCPSKPKPCPSKPKPCPSKPKPPKSNGCRSQQQSNSINKRSSAMRRHTDSRHALSHNKRASQATLRKGSLCDSRRLAENGERVRKSASRQNSEQRVNRAHDEGEASGSSAASCRKSVKRKHSSRHSCCSMGIKAVCSKAKYQVVNVVETNDGFEIDYNGHTTSFKGPKCEKDKLIPPERCIFFIYGRPYTGEDLGCLVQYMRDLQKIEDQEACRKNREEKEAKQSKTVTRSPKKKLKCK